jgi:hypothetical protein
MAEVLRGGSGTRSSGDRRRQAGCGVMTVLVLLLCLFCPLTLAGPAGQPEARKAVQGWLHLDSRPLGMAIGATVTRVDTFSDAQGQPAYHVVYLNPNGFVIVPADDDVEPIVAFVSGGTFDPSPDNPLGALAGTDLPARVSAMKNLQKQHGAAPLNSKASKWQRLFQAADGVTMYGISAASGISDIRVAPLIASRWSQTYEGTACYNYYTPNYYPCGCVATAMAQMMRYYQYPTAGIGKQLFQITVDGVSQSVYTRGGDGAGGPYNWSAMVLDPDTATTDPQRQAIGALCYDAGLSVKMDYASGGSGAILGELALVATFGYSNAIRGYNSSGFTLAALTPMLNPNLDAGFPAMLGIRGPAGGHAIVADGYGYSSGTLYHHLNMGWAGYQDAWYNLPNIDAAAPGPFSTVFDCGYNVYVSGSGEILSGRVLDNTGAPLAGATVMGVRTGGGTYNATTNAQGIYALAKIPSKSTCTVSVTAAGFTFANQIVSLGKSASNSASTGNLWGVDFTGTVVVFLLGDINRDGHVDSTDRQILSQSWGKAVGDPGYDPACDLNGDGHVDIVDLLILADNWGK